MTRRIDLSHLVAGLPPIFFVNSESPSDRTRFSLAHEVGHVIMHQTPVGDQEAQADQFASEFLLPSREVGPQLKPISVERAAALKPYWKVSMAAIIKKAFDLKKISESYYRKLFTQMSKLGYRLNEPNPLMPEEPTVINDLIGVHLTELHYSVPELADVVCEKEHRFRERYNLVESPKLRLAN